MSKLQLRLRDFVETTIILAYKEDTSALEGVLTAQGLHPSVSRPNYSEKQLTYSRTIRCLLNHASAWAKASAGQKYTMIVEADFVPCRDIGALRPPFNPELHGDAAWAFLYSSAPKLLRVHPDGALQGHAACPVAYIVSPRVARWLCEYVEEELVRQADLTAYSLWDTQFQWHIMGKGGICFMPWRSYGEHGGLGNPEHARAGVGVAKRITWLQRLGIGRHHFAEALLGPLAFLPEYASGSRWRFVVTRAEAKFVAVAKLLSGRIVGRLGENTPWDQLRLYWKAALRLCTWR